MFSELASIGAGVEAGGRSADSSPLSFGAAGGSEEEQPVDGFAALLGAFLGAAAEPVASLGDEMLLAAPVAAHEAAPDAAASSPDDSARGGPSVGRGSRSSPAEIGSVGRGSRSSPAEIGPFVGRGSRSSPAELGSQMEPVVSSVGLGTQTSPAETAPESGIPDAADDPPSRVARQEARLPSKIELLRDNPAVRSGVSAPQSWPAIVREALAEAVEQPSADPAHASSVDALAPTRPAHQAMAAMTLPAPAPQDAGAAAVAPTPPDVSAPPSTAATQSSVGNPGSGPGGQDESPADRSAPRGPAAPLPPVDAAPAFAEMTPEIRDALVTGGRTEAAARPAADVPDVLPQLVRSIRLQALGDVGQARVQLRPEHLGEVQIDLRVERGEVVASMQVERAEVREWIQTRVDDLRSALQAQGLQLAHLNVSEHGQRREADEGKEQRSKGKGKSRARGDRGDQRAFVLHL